MVALGKGTAALAIVGSIVLAFRKLAKTPKAKESGEMSPRDYALHSVFPTFLLFLFTKGTVANDQF